MGDGWAVLTIIFGIAMIASTADTLQSGMTAVLWPVANALCPSLCAAPIPANAIDACRSGALQHILKSRVST